MRKIIVICCLLCIVSVVRAQSDSAMKTFVDSVCKCLSKQDIDKIKTKADAQMALSACFLSDNMGGIMKVAEARGINITDQAAMEKLGQEVGIELMKQNCNSFIQLSIKMAKGGDDEEKMELAITHSTTGTLSSVETKDFCKFIVTDASGKKNTFYWLHHFNDSEKFMQLPTKYVGKKLKISWEETEVYVPAAKGYYKIKEIKGIQVL